MARAAANRHAAHEGSAVIPAEARGAWHDIERRLRPYVARRVASGAEIDDIVQEILVRVHKGLDSIKDDERFGGWVYRIAERTIADAARSRARLPASLPEDLAETPTVAADEAADLQRELGSAWRSS